MKLFKTFFSLAVMLLVFASCSKNDYLKVIPKDAVMVSYVDMADIAKKGDIANSDLFKSAMDEVSTEYREDVKKYTDDPMKMGVDLSAPVYYFTTPSMYAGIVAKVDSESNLEEFLTYLHKKDVCSKPVKKDGKYTGSIFSDAHYMFDGQTLLVYVSVNNTNSNAVRKVVDKWWEQDDDDSFVSTEAFDHLTGLDADMATYCNVGGLVNTQTATSGSTDGAMLMKSMLPKGARMSDFDIYYTLSFLDGKAVGASEVVGRTDKAKAQLEEMGSHMKKIEGRYVESPAEDCFFWACAGVDGQWGLQQLKENQTAKQMLYLLERGIDIEQIIGAVDGDVAIAASVDLSNSFPFEIMATARVKDTKFLADVNDWKTSMKAYGMSMTEDAKNQFTLNASDMSINWGVESDNVYIATSNAYRKNAFSKHTDMLRDYKDDIKDSYGYAYINFKNLPKECLGILGSITQITDRLAKIKCVVVRCKETNKTEVICEMNDSETNFLKQLL